MTNMGRAECNLPVTMATGVDDDPASGAGHGSTKADERSGPRDTEGK